MKPQLHQGSEIFRNQPSYKIFNKSFEQWDDALFTFLNEMEPDIFKEEEEKPADVFFAYSCSFSRQDPRTRQVVDRPLKDHTTSQLAYGFPNSQQRYSSLGRKQQAACLRVLLAWQTNSQVDKADILVWNTTNDKRCTEQQLVQKHIYEYAQGQKERLLAPMKQLAQHYCTWYKLRVNQLLPRLPQVSYCTYCGLPQLPLCKGLNVNSASMEHLQLICRAGQVRLWKKVCLSQQLLSNLRVRLERYAYSEEVNETARATVAVQLEHLLLEAEEHVYVLPLEALLMLLTPGAYVDLPTEMLLNIRELEDGQHKSFEFQQPLPARNCGWHTNSRLLTQAYASYAPAQWLEFKGEGVELILEKKEEQQQEKQQQDYKPQPWAAPPESLKKTNDNCALISWRLRADQETEPGLQLYSSVSIPAVTDVRGKQLLGCHLIKLETKPDCGCELMTKYELLSAWLQLKLLQTDHGHCSRISMQNFEILLEEELTLDIIEKQLYENYQISMPQQLCHLQEFLKMLRSVPPGEYLLRYTTKYSDQFLLCQPALEATPQYFQLQELLTGTPPTAVNFLTQSNSYLPISPTLCSRLHVEQQLLPCAFPAKEQGVKCSNKPPELENKPLVQRKRAKIPKKSESKKRKRALQRQKRKETAKKDQKQDEELDKIMCL